MDQGQNNILRFALLLMLCSLHYSLYSQNAFSVERISVSEFENAKSEFDQNNAAIVTPSEYNDVVNQVLQNARQSFESLPPLRKTEVLEEIGEDLGFDMDHMLFIPDWNMYGFLLPTIFDAIIWWYDGTSGKRIGDTESTPIAANVNGIYVSQISYDCDWKLDLHFCRRGAEYLYEFATFCDKRFNGEYQLLIENTFWGNDNTLYLHTYDYDASQDCYLRIRLSIE